MLYDPKWERKTETRADPLKLGTLIAWLEKKPSGKTYTYTDNQNCLLCQYFRAHGIQVDNIVRNEITNAFGKIEFPEAFDWDIACSCDDEDTFGNALERARKVAANS